MNAPPCHSAASDVQAASRSLVGAGPAGLTAALAARAAGAEVTVCEKRPAVGARFHGDFQGLENRRRRERVRVASRLYGGESAGLQDALFGFGVRYALLSGHFAARAWLAGSSNSSERQRHTRLRDYVCTGLINRRLYQCKKRGPPRREPMPGCNCTWWRRRESERATGLKQPITLFEFNHLGGERSCSFPAC